MYTVYECTDSPKFTMKLTEIYRYMATHDSHSKFWACDAELTELIVCRKSRFLLENRPRVPPYRTVSCSWVSCMAACGGCGAAAAATSKYAGHGTGCSAARPVLLPG